MARGTGVQADAKANKVHEVARIVARVVAVAAAMATVATSVHEMGLDGAPTRRTVGNFGATWVGLSPAVDTVTSIGDTVHLAATVTDKHGTALVGTSTRWTVDHPDIVSINADGTVIARAAGMATVVVTLGDLVARAAIVVRPVAAAVHIAADSAVTIAEQSTRGVTATATDGRGHVVAARVARWRSSDTSVLTVDSTGVLTGVNAGHATITATRDGASADAPITVVPIPGSLALIAGNNQTAPAGAGLPAAVIVRVLSRHGRPMAGLPVRFRRADASSTAEVATLTTDMDGRARCSWKLGDLAGRQRLVASTDGVDSVLAIDADAEPVSANTRAVVLADTQSARIATALAAPVGVRLTDTTGRVMADVAIRWMAVDGGTITAMTPRTDSLGEAHAVWVVGPHAGMQRIRVMIGNGRTVRPLTLRAVALPGPAATMTVVSGDAQHAAPGAALPKPVVIRVQDAAGNAVPGVKMSLTPTHGVVADSAAVTDLHGIVSQRWTLGGAVGPQHVTARVDGVVKTVAVTATALPSVTHAPVGHAKHHRSV